MALTSGDIALIGYITNGSPDSFSFVSLTSIAAGEVIYFTDNGWTGTAFRGASATDGDGNENLIKFTAVNAIAAGTVIRSTDTSANFTWTKSGSIPGTTNGAFADLSFSQTGEQIAAFQSGTNNPLFSGFTAIHQVDNTGTFEDATSSSQGNVITGLSQVNNTAVLLNNTATYAAFNISSLTSGTKAQWLAAINNASNWTFSNLTSLPTGSITVSSGNPTVNLSVSSNTGTEAGTTVITVTATASNAVSGNQTISLGVSGTGITTGDYSLSNTTITIANGQTTGSVTFTVADDALVEGTETATLTISSPSSGITLGTTTSQNIVITDNDGSGTLSYSTSTLNEARAFDGSINDKIIITLTGTDSFTGSNGDNLITGSKATISNVPTGLTAVLTRTSATTAELSFTGTATNNANANDLSNISLVFNNSAFLGGNAAAIIGSTKSDLGINFGDLGSVGSIQTFTPNAGTTLGSSDASTAIALDANWMVVGDDEASVLRVYARTGGAAVAEWNFGSSLGTGTNEVDIEASTRIGDTLYFIGSHSNKKDGSEQVSRENLFAVTVSGTGANTQFTYVGKNNQLENALISWDISNIHGKGANYFGLSASSAVGVIPENVNGFSIEGMTASQDGTQLLLGLRAPQSDTSSREKAIVVPVTLSGLITSGGTNTPTFGTAIELNLGGRGIRSIEKSVGGGYLILAGPAGSATPEVTNDFRLFRWDGSSTTATELNVDLDTLRDVTGGSFETIVDVLSTSQGTLVQLLQDNGDTIWPGKSVVSKDLPAAEQQFQGNWISLGADVIDTTAPTLASSSPADNGTNVAVNADLVLKFNEGVKAGAGNFTIKKTSDNSTVETIAATDAKVTIAYNTVTINPTATLDIATSYYLEASNTAITDHAGNAWAGLTGATAYDFTTLVPTPLPKVLITEVNSNSTGGDFFEIYNYGTTAIDLTGWKWNDETAAFSSGTAIPTTTLNAGATLVVVNTTDAAAFRTAWGLSVSTAVIATGGPGLGSADGVALFDATGQLVTGFNYKTTAITASDGSVIQPVSRTDNSAVVAGHAGVAVGAAAGANSVSAVWDGQSTTAPKYTYAQASQAGVLTQTNGVGSPGFAAIAKIHDIQGSGTTAALTGTQTIEGIVTRKFSGLSGFYVQEEDADTDGNAATSEGIFVYDPTGLFTGNEGDKVRITGTVSEFTSTSSNIAGTGNSSLTQLSSLTNVTNLGAAALPTVTNVTLPVANTTDLERYEGMLVNISGGSSPLVVTETFKLGRFGQVGLSVGDRLGQYTQFNAPSVAGYANYLANLQDGYIILDDGRTSQNPDPTIHARGGQPLSATNTLRGGDTIASITGILDERFEGYRVQTTTPANFQPTNTRPVTPPSVGGTLRVASANLLNFFNGSGIDANGDGLIDGGFPTSRGASNATEFKRQIDKTVQEVLGLNADVFGYNEMENDGYGSTSAIQTLVNALNAATAPGTYAFITPPAGALINGNFGGDEITVGFIYKTAAVRVAPGSSVAALTTGIFAQDAANRVQRPALAATFEQLSTGETFTTVINHFKSKGTAANLPGDADQLDGQGQSNATRTQAAQELAAWLATKPTGTNDSDYLIMGDLNAYRLEDPITTLTNAGYTSLFDAGSYSYQFNGQWGSLDHALASSSLNSQVTGAAKWHINADEPIVLDYNTEFKSAGQVTSFYNVDPFRTSDHDPILVGLKLNSTPTNISLSANSINENVAANSVIGSFSTTDITIGDTFSYSLVGGADSAAFTISGNQLLIKASPDFEAKSSYSVVVRSTDGGGLFVDKSFTININNLNEAPVLTNQIPSQQAQNGKAFSFILPSNTFTDPDAGTTLSYTLTQKPSWLSFDSNTRTFSGTPTATGTNTISVQASDGSLNSGIANFNIVVTDPVNVDTNQSSQPSLVLSGATANIIACGNNDDNIDASATTGNNNFSGGGGNDTLIGGAGNEIIDGGTGNDTLTGNAGVDRLYGGDGIDTLIGGAGRDLLVGGGGADLFVLGTLGVNGDTIQDFNQSQGDQIGLTGGITFGSLTFTQNSTRTEIRNGSELLATLLNYNNGLNPLIAANFVAYP